MTNIIKMILPKGLLIRTLSLVIIGIIIIQLFVVSFFMYRNSSDFLNSFSNSVARDANFVFTVIANKTAIKQNTIYKYLRINMRKLNLRSLPDVTNTKAIYRITAKRINNQLIFPAKVLIKNNNTLVIYAKAKENIYALTIKNRKVLALSYYLFIFFDLLISIVIILIISIFIKNQIRPIIQLSKAADEISKNNFDISIIPRGSKEIRNAIKAFNSMSFALRRHQNQTSKMLISINQSLLRKLSNIKLQLNIMDDSPTSKEIAIQINKLENIINEYKDFANKNIEEKVSNINLKALLTDLVVDKKIQLNFPNHDINANLRPLSFSKAMRFLLDNALKYSTKIIVSVSDSHKHEIKITIDDNGKIIPITKRQKVFEPFYVLKGEKTAGLGLSIAKNILKAHKASIEIRKSPMSGTRIVIILKKQAMIR